MESRAWAGGVSSKRSETAEHPLAPDERPMGVRKPFEYERHAEGAIGLLQGVLAYNIAAWRGWRRCSSANKTCCKPI